MKKIVLLAGLTLSLGTSFKSVAQVHVNINVGAPVVQQGWYAHDDDYYYMPEQGVYYNVRRRVYVYPDGGNWMYANNLPARYGNYCYANSHYYHVHACAPFNRHDYYSGQYAYRGNQGNHDHGNNGNHRGWNGHGNGNGNGNGNGHRDNHNWNNGNNGGGSSHYTRD